MPKIKVRELTEKFYTVNEVCDKIALKRKQVYNLMKSGALDYVQSTPRKRLVPESAIISMINRKK